MRLALDIKGEHIEYCPILREYNITGNKGFKMFYCPWCGSILPKRLRDEFFDILEKEYGIDSDIFEVLHNPKLPEEFRTDEWWKKRGL